MNFIPNNSSYPRMETIIYQDDGHREFLFSYRENYQSLISQASRLSRTVNCDAEDLLSMAVLKVLNFKESGGIPESVIALLRISLLQAQMDLKKSNREKIFMNFHPLHDDYTLFDQENLHRKHAVDREIDLKNWLTEIHAIVEKMSEIDREIFYMRFIEEKAYSEIADELGISTANARQKIKMIRRKIKEQMKGDYSLN